MMTQFHVLAPVLLVASLAAGPALAAQPDAPLTAAVRLNDLDVTRPQGAERAYERLAAAAERVCPPLISNDIQAHARMHGCVRKAIADGVAKLNQPALTAVYVSHLDLRPATAIAMATTR